MATNLESHLPAYSEDQLLVTFSPAAAPALSLRAVEAAAPFVSRTVSASLIALAAGGGALVTSGAIPTLELLGGGDGLQPLLDLERQGLIIDAIPLRGPSDIGGASSSVPLGAGRMFAAAAEAVGGERPSDQFLGNSILVSVEPGRLEVARRHLAAQGGTIKLVERVPRRYLQEVVPLEAQLPIDPWHLSRIGLDRARAAAAGFDDGSDVTVAVLDTGIDRNHPLLEPVLRHYSYTPPNPSIFSGWPDLSSHGTHVAGTISAAGQAGNIQGVSRAGIAAYKIFDDQIDRVGSFVGDDGRTYAYDVRYVNTVMYLRALAACVDQNHDVVNLSIGGPAIGDSEEQGLFDLMREQGQIVVAAMGNERRAKSPISWPAKYDGVIAVGALDVNDAVAPFSNKGDHIWISAPGTDIFATMPIYKGVERWTTRVDAKGRTVRDQAIHWTVYRSSKSGTSMAAPQIAAAAALWTAKNGRDAAGFRDALRETARKLSSMQGINFTLDHGYGCLDLEALLR